LNIIQHVIEHHDGDLSLGKWSLCNAALRGHGHIINWLIENGHAGALDKSIWQHAADGDDRSDDDVIETLELLMRHNFPKTRGALSSAAKKGRMKVIKWFVTNKFGFYPLYLIEAAASGSKEAVQFGMANGFQLTKVVIGNAAVNNQAEMVKWLASPEMHCPYDEQVMSGAAKNGDLELMKYLLAIGIERNVPDWHEAAIIGAAQGGHLHIIQFAIKSYEQSQDPPSDPVQAGPSSTATQPAVRRLKLPITACEAAIINHHEHVLRWLVEHGAEWPVHSQMAALLFGLWNTVVWAVESGLFDKSLINDIGVVAARLSRIDAMQWALKHSSLKCTQVVIKQAVQSQNFDFIRWLRRHKIGPSDDDDDDDEAPFASVPTNTAATLEHESTLDTAGLVLSNPDEPRWSESE